MKIILASASPRRKEILENHGISPLVIPSETEEVVPGDVEALGVEEIVKYLAHIKATSVYEKQKEFHLDSEEKLYVLGADTIVYKHHIIGKPVDEQDAVSILQSLRNTSHYVYTGVSLIDFFSGEETLFCEGTKVYFNDYSDEEILRFIREEPPYDKSGSYAIQSSWSKNVNRIEGDVENVIGLPWTRLASYIA